MFKMTKDDLAKKTASQLAALFQDASKVVREASPPNLTAAQSLVAMIRSELARRGPCR